MSADDRAVDAPAFFVDFDFTLQTLGDGEGRPSLKAQMIERVTPKMHRGSAPKGSHRRSRGLRPPA